MSLEKEIESCPNCGSIFIQYDGDQDEVYCLMRDCNYKWKMEIKDIDEIRNFFLRASLTKYKRFLQPA